VGEIDAENVGIAIDALLDGLTTTTAALSRESTPDFTARRILLHRPEAQVTNLAFIAPVPPTRQGGEMEDLLLIHALGGDDQSVLFDAVRTELRAGYFFWAGLVNYTRDHRILFLTGEVETAKLANAERVVRDAYAARSRRSGTIGPNPAKPLSARMRGSVEDSECADWARMRHGLQPTRRSMPVDICQLDNLRWERGSGFHS